MPVFLCQHGESLLCGGVDLASFHGSPRVPASKAYREVVWPLCMITRPLACNREVASLALKWIHAVSLVVTGLDVLASGLNPRDFLHRSGSGHFYTSWSQELASCPSDQERGCNDHNVENQHTRCAIDAGLLQNIHRSKQDVRDDAARDCHRERLAAHHAGLENRVNHPAETEDEKQRSSQDAAARFKPSNKSCDGMEHSVEEQQAIPA